MGEEWSVIAEPCGENDGDKNTSGIKVLLTNGDIRHEVTRVAFVREFSKNPDVPFEEKFNEVVTKAEGATDVINDLLDEFDRIQAQKVDAAREKLRELFGRPPVHNAKPE